MSLEPDEAVFRRREKVKDLRAEAQRLLAAADALERRNNDWWRRKTAHWHNDDGRAALSEAEDKK